MLKTNYKDDIFEQKRKYRQEQNTDGTISFVDTTEYTQVGDRFGANDINATNLEINALASLRQITLLVKNWQGETAPFTQSVSVEGIREIDNPILVSILSDTADTSAAKAYNKAFGIVASGSGTTADNSVTFRVYKKPSIDIIVGLKGV